MEKLITITPTQLVGIAEAARLWFKEKNEIYHTFILEEKKAKELRDKIWNKDWDNDVKLFIDEMPF